METQYDYRPVVVACPDARPPAYQAAIGLNRAGQLGRFVTSSYYDPTGFLATIGRRLAPTQFDHWEKVLRRRYDPEIPATRVTAIPSFDLALRLEARCGSHAASRGMKRMIAKARTTAFDHRLARIITKDHPKVLLLFSDVGSATTLPRCRRLGIPTVLSMVHGDVREEVEILNEEADFAADFFPLYLGDETLDRIELDWLHHRRLRDIELADHILVPSGHIANRLIFHGTPPHKIRVIPYAADCRRFRPDSNKQHDATCTFLFAGGISQRKGIKYLLEAWSQIRRPGWMLQLLGALPKNLRPLTPYLDQVELLGRVAHSDVPTYMARADVFVFPSLFEGSAVVTYEALACGLPSVVTPSAGSVIREGIEGFMVKPRDVEALAQCMERLGLSPELRAAMSTAARRRALEFDWPRYHDALNAVVIKLISGTPERGNPRPHDQGTD